MFKRGNIVKFKCGFWGNVNSPETGKLGVIEYSYGERYGNGDVYGGYSVLDKETGGSSSCDEFGEETNNLVDSYGNKDRKSGWLRTQDEYILVVDGAFRDRMFDQTFREFMKWLCRLGKRVGIEDVLVDVRGYGKSTIIRNTNIQNEKYSYRKVFDGLFEDPSWCNDTGEPNWCEFMMYDRAKNSDYPMLLAYKYFNDEENDREVERRMEYERR